MNSIFFIKRGSNLINHIIPTKSDKQSATAEGSTNTFKLNRCL
jgi:hypothetical protein